VTGAFLWAVFFLPAGLFDGIHQDDPPTGDDHGDEQ